MSSFNNLFYVKDTTCGKKSTSQHINKTNNEIAICCGVEKNNQYQYRWLFCCNYFPQDKHKSKYLKIGFISAGKKWHKWKKNRKQLISISNPPGKEYPFVDKPFRMVKDVLLCSTVTLRNNINPSNNASSVILNFNWIKQQLIAFCFNSPIVVS